MADLMKLSCNSLSFSSSILTAFSSSLDSSQRALSFSQRLHRRIVSVSDISSVGGEFVSPNPFKSSKQLPFFKIVDGFEVQMVESFVPNPVLISFQSYKAGWISKIKATATETEPPKWWERNAGPNMIDIHSTQEFLNALSQAGDKLVIVEFYGTWCASCRALFPKLCRTAEEHPDILFLKVNFDENKPMCKSLNVKVLPNFHFYRGADGQLEAFSCSLAKFQKIKDAIALHNTARCSIGPPRGVGELNLESLSAPKEKQPESSAT